MEMNFENFKEYFNKNIEDKVNFENSVLGRSIRLSYKSSILCLVSVPLSFAYLGSHLGGFREFYIENNIVETCNINVRGPKYKPPKLNCSWENFNDLNMTGAIMGGLIGLAVQGKLNEIAGTNLEDYLFSNPIIFEKLNEISDKLYSLF